MSVMPSHGGTPSAVRARRASPVSASPASIASRSREGKSAPARSRPNGDAANRASKSWNAFQPSTSPDVTPPSIGSGAAAPGASPGTPGPRPMPARSVRIPLPALRLLARRQRLALPPDARLLVVLTLLELGEKASLLALLLEAFECALEGLIGLHDDLRQLTVPLPSVSRLDKRLAYIINTPPCPCDP